jgi:hypothetical protein
VTPLRRFACFFLCVAVLSGCGGDGKLKARGKVVKGGIPFTVPEEEYVRITFYPVLPDGKFGANTYAAVYSNNDGSFSVFGADGRGLPPGKYRAAVEHERKRKDVFRGAYDADRSPFVFDIDAKNMELVIDLDTPPAR